VNTASTDDGEAVLGLFFAFYNFCGPHMTLTEDMDFRCTPGMRAGLANEVWSLSNLLERVRAVE
jgi:hypothetical protein